MEDIIKIVNSLEDSDLLLKRVTETVQNEKKEQKGGFLSMLLGTLGASLLGNVLAANKKSKGIIRAGEGATKSTIQGQGIVRAGHGHRSSSFSKNKNSKMEF